MQPKKRWGRCLLALVVCVGLISLLYGCYVPGVLTKAASVCARSVSFASNAPFLYTDSGSMYIMCGDGEFSTLQKTTGWRTRTVIPAPFVSLLNGIAFCDGEMYYSSMANGLPVYFPLGNAIPDGILLGGEGGLLFIDRKNTVYSCSPSTGEERALFTYDHLAATYADGILYERGEMAYFCDFSAPNEPIQVCAQPLYALFGYLTWQGAVWSDCKYLYLGDQIIEISLNDIRIIDLETGERTTITETEHEHTKSACADADDEYLYVSMRAVSNYYPIEDEGWNGTWRYCFADGSWEKLDRRFYFDLGKVNSSALFGKTEFDFIHQIALDSKGRAATD